MIFFLVLFQYYSQFFIFKSCSIPSYKQQKHVQAALFRFGLQIALKNKNKLKNNARNTVYWCCVPILRQGFDIRKLFPCLTFP